MAHISLATEHRVGTGPEMINPSRPSAPYNHRERSRTPRTDTNVAADGIGLQVRWENRGESRTVWAIGEVDLASVEELRRALDCSQRRLRIDLSGVTFIDLLGLRCLMDVARRSRSVTLVVSPRVERLLDLTGTGHLFDTEKNSET